MLRQAGAAAGGAGNHGRGRHEFLLRRRTGTLTNPSLKPHLAADHQHLLGAPVDVEVQKVTAAGLKGYVRIPTTTRGDVGDAYGATLKEAAEALGEP